MRDDCTACQVEHGSEASTWEELSRLLTHIKTSARRGASEVTSLIDQLHQAAEAACRRISLHMRREELQVGLPSPAGFVLLA